MPIVTGFVDLGRWECRQRSRAEYVAQAKAFLACPLPMILFSDTDSRSELLALRPVDAPTQWLDAEFNPSEADISALRAGLERSAIPWNPSKDTARYFCLIRDKLTWLRRAAQLNPFDSDCFWWMDIGYRHMNLADVIRVLAKAPPMGMLRLGELSYVPHSVRSKREQFYASHWWPVGAGLIAARAPELRWLDEQVETEWRWTLEHGLPATEEMMLGFIRYQNLNRFDAYYADHCSLLVNYLAARESHPLIIRMAQRALEDGNVAEAAARLNAIVPYLTQ